MRVWLGNSHAVEARQVPTGAKEHDDGTVEITGWRTAQVALKGNRVTFVNIPDSYSMTEALAVVLAPDGVWRHHSAGDGVHDHRPDWVESDTPGLAEAIARDLECPVGRPKGWKEAEG